jgi:hypothetical protein
LLNDFKNKIDVAGATISTVVRIWGPPAKPVVSGQSLCNEDGEAYINLNWEEDENATSYDVYRDDEEILLGMTNNYFNDLVPILDQEHSYYVVAKGPAGISTSDSINILTEVCQIDIPTISLNLIDGNILNENGGITKTNEKRPFFQGQTSIPNINLKIEIDSSLILQGTTYSNNSGYWQWQTPSNLDYGMETIYVSVLEGEEIISSESWIFEIVEEEEDEISDEDEENDEDSEINDGIYFIDEISGNDYQSEKQELKEEDISRIEEDFDFNMKIRNQAYIEGVSMKEDFYRGENMELIILINNNINNAEKANINYKIYSLDQKNVFDHSEEVSLKNINKIIKKIYLPYDMELGKYKIQISMKVNDVIVSHENYFILKDRPVIKIGSTYLTYQNLISNVGWILFLFLLLFLFLILFIIWEYRLSQGAINQITSKFLKKKGFVG